MTTDPSLIETLRGPRRLPCHTFEREAIARAGSGVVSGIYAFDDAYMPSRLELNSSGTCFYSCGWRDFSGCEDRYAYPKYQIGTSNGTYTCTPTHVTVKLEKELDGHKEFVFRIEDDGGKLVREGNADLSATAQFTWQESVDPATKTQAPEHLTNRVLVRRAF